MLFVVMIYSFCLHWFGFDSIGDDSIRLSSLGLD